MTGFHTCGAEGRTKDLSIRIRLFVTFEDKDYTTEEFCSVVKETQQVTEIATATMIQFIDDLRKKKPKKRTKKGAQ